MFSAQKQYILKRIIPAEKKRAEERVGSEVVCVRARAETRRLKEEAMAMAMAMAAVKKKREQIL